MKYPKGKIAVVAAISGTLGKLLFAQIKSAQQAGFQVHGLCARGNDFDMLQKNGVLMYNLRIKRSISPFSDLVTIWDMYRYFRREKITIVHTHTPKAGLLGQLAAKLAGVPIIINTVHGYYFHENMKPLTRWFYIFMEWISARCSTMILSQNPEDVETAIKLGICKHNKIKLLGNGVDLFKFEPSRFDSDCRNKKRREIGLPEDAIVVGIIGRLVKEKGYLELYEAIKTLISTYDKVWLIIIGIKEPEKADRISHDAFVKYGIAHRTLWLGRRDDIPELLSCCDIYTLPSWREGFPRSAIEAAAMALPIVATNIRGCRQVVADGINGFLVPVHDVRQLEAALKKLIDDPEMRHNMGCAGYHKARKEFDERRVCKIVIETYNHLLSAKGLPPLLRLGNGLY